MRVKQVLLIEVDAGINMLVVPKSHIVLEIHGEKVFLGFERALKLIEAFKLAEKVLKEGDKQ